MITSIFKNTGFSYTIVFFISFILWTLKIYDTNVEDTISLTINSQTLELNKIVAQVLSLFLTILGGLYINFRLQNHLFGYENSHLFFLFYVLLSSFSLKTDFFLPYLILSSSLLIFSNILIQLIHGQKKENSLFNASFLLGILCIHNFMFLTLLPFLFISIDTVKSIKPKDITLIFTGILLPLLFILLFTVLTDNIEPLEQIFYINWHIPTINWKAVILLLPIGIISFLGRKSFLKNRFGAELNIYKLTDILTLLYFFLLLTSVLSIFIFEFEYFVFVLSIPISVFLTKYFINTEYKQKEFLLFLLLLFMILIVV